MQAVFDLGCRAEVKLEEIRHIAKRQAIPFRYLSEILRSLMEAGIVRCRRGQKGGCYSLRRPSGITVADVFRATNGAITKPGSGEPARGTADYDHNGFLVINAVWKEAETHFMEYLESVTIEDLCENAKHGMKSEVLGPMGRFKETLKKA